MCPLYLKKKTTLPPTLHHHSLWIIHLNRKTQISDFCHPSFKSGSRSITSKNSARDNMRSPSMSRVPWIQGGCTLKMLWVQRALNYSKKKQKFINQTWMMTLQKCMSLYVYIYIYILMYIRMYVYMYLSYLRHLECRSGPWESRHEATWWNKKNPRRLNSKIQPALMCTLVLIRVYEVNYGYSNWTNLFTTLLREPEEIPPPPQPLRCPRDEQSHK